MFNGIPSFCQWARVNRVVKIHSGHKRVKGVRRLPFAEMKVNPSSDTVTSHEIWDSSVVGQYNKDREKRYKDWNIPRSVGRRYLVSSSMWKSNRKVGSKVVPEYSISRRKLLRLRQLYLVLGAKPNNGAPTSSLHPPAMIETASQNPVYNINRSNSIIQAYLIYWNVPGYSWLKVGYLQFILLPSTHCGGVHRMRGACVFPQDISPRPETTLYIYDCLSASALRLCWVGQGRASEWSFDLSRLIEAWGCL